MDFQLRNISGSPSQRVLKKQLSSLDIHCRAFIERSPFVLISSSDASGNMDISPRGDPAGFVAILDDTTLAIPDRPGNRRADTFRNILQNPHVALIFLIPGKQDTLRVSGTATIVRDQWIRERMTVDGKVPELALIVSVQEAFLHCPKCIIRSKLWDWSAWPEIADVSSFAQAMVEQTDLGESVEEMQVLIEKDAKERLY